MKTTILISAVLLAAAALPAGGEHVTYAYDSAGRLTGVSHGSGKSTAFHYDAAGNLLQESSVAIVDSDNDGMADAWEMTNFGTLARDGKGDFDGDGMSDLAEYLAGTSPKDPKSLLRLHQYLGAAGVQTQVTWDSVAGVNYRLQYKITFADAGWNDVPGEVKALGAITSKTDPTGTGEPERYYRVQVVP